MLVPIKKWLESEGRNFKWNVCKVAIFAASRGGLRDGQKKGRKIQRSKVTAISQRGNMKLACKRIHTRCAQTTNRVAWPQWSSCVPRGVRTLRGYFRGRVAVTGDHHRPSIKLTSQQPGGRSCAAAWLFRRAWDLREEAESEGRGWHHVHQNWLRWRKNKEWFKTWTPHRDRSESRPCWPSGALLPPSGHREEVVRTLEWRFCAILNAKTPSREFKFVVFRCWWFNQSIKTSKKLCRLWKIRGSNEREEECRCIGNEYYFIPKKHIFLQIKQKRNHQSDSQLTQKFKTPVSSRDANWKDSPDDSGLRETTTMNHEVKCERARNKWFCVVVKGSAMISDLTRTLLPSTPHLPQMPGVETPACLPLPQMVRPLQTSPAIDGLSSPSQRLQ